MLKNTDIYSKYSKTIEKFKKEIYFYCDYNINSEVLFPAFVNLWPENVGQNRCLSGKDLAIVTSDILQELVDKGVLIVISKDERSHNPYALYKIQEHKNLMKYNPFIEKKIEIINLLNAPLKKI
ncbi:MAG: hypothetical protein ACP5NZ_02985 [Nanobdellota archaeon]